MKVGFRQCLMYVKVEVCFASDFSVQSPRILIVVDLADVPSE